MTTETVRTSILSRQTRETSQRLGLASVIAILFAITFSRIYPPVFLALILCAAFPRFRTWIIAAASIVSMLVFLSSKADLFSLYYSMRGLADLSLSQLAVMYGAFLAALYGYFRLAAQSPLRFHFMIPVGALFALSLLVSFPERKNPYLIILYMVGCYHLWYAVFFSLYVERTKRFALNEFLCSLATPFWCLIIDPTRSLFSATGIPVPGLLHTSLNRSTEEHSPYLRTQLSGLRLMVWIVALYTLERFLTNIGDRNAVVRCAAYYWNAAGFGFNNNHFLNFSWGERWAITLLGPIFFLLRSTTSYGSMVVLARACGIPLFRNVYKPFSAPTLYEFYARQVHYYNEILVRVFMTDFFKRLRFIRSARAKTFWVVFSALSVGGVVFHYFRSLDQLVQRSGYEFISGMFSYSIGWIAIGGVVGISVAYERGVVRSKRFLPNALRVTGYYVIFSVVYLLVKEHEENVAGLGDRISFILSLFSIR